MRFMGDALDGHIVVEAYRVYAILFITQDLLSIPRMVSRRWPSRQYFCRGGLHKHLLESRNISRGETYIVCVGGVSHRVTNWLL